MAADPADDAQETPDDPRAIAMLAALFGQDWRDKLGTEVAFERGPMNSWVNAIETMLSAADAADPLRIAIRNVVSPGESSSGAGSNLPTSS